MQANKRDLAAGATFVAIGLFFGLNAWINLPIGAALSMGPGYFPVLLGSILVCFGLAIAVPAAGRAAESFGQIAWRGVGLVMAAIVFFALTVRGLGLGPALGGATLLAAMSSRRVTWREAVLLSIALTAFCIVVFVYGLRLPYAVIGPWLKG